MIGVEDGTAFMGSGPNRLKRDIMFFDRLTLMGAMEAIAMWRHGPYDKQRYRDYAADVEFLLETPLFEAVVWQDMPGSIDAPETQDQRDYNEALKQLADTTEEINRISPSDGPPQSSDQNPELRKLEYLIPLQRSLVPRVEALRQRLAGKSAVSLSPIPAQEGRHVNGKLASGDVMQLAIKRVHVPDELTPWQDIMALKEDRALSERANKLSQWARKIAKSESLLEEADAMLSDLLADYERYLSAHNMKFTSTALQTVVVGGGSLLEDIAKAKVGKLADRLFGARKFKADLLLSEMKAPGREVSIVTVLNDRFR